jgi:hypothetical protein
VPEVMGVTGLPSQLAKGLRTPRTARSFAHCGQGTSLLRARLQISWIRFLESGRAPVWNTMPSGSRAGWVPRWSARARTGDRYGDPRYRREVRLQGTDARRLWVLEATGAEERPTVWTALLDHPLHLPAALRSAVEVPVVIEVPPIGSSRSPPSQPSSRLLGWAQPRGQDEADGTRIYRCLICSLERTHIEIAG